MFTAEPMAASGVRSSWLTSEAKRASRTIRSWRASTISLNDAISGVRSGSPLASRRVSRAPWEIRDAAVATPRNGRSTRLLA